MCVALPGTVVKMDGNIAEVDFSGNVVRAQAGLVHCNAGDSVLVHAGCIIQILTKSDAQAMEDLFREIGAL